MYRKKKKKPEMCEKKERAYAVYTTVHAREQPTRLHTRFIATVGNERKARHPESTHSSASSAAMLHLLSQWRRSFYTLLWEKKERRDYNKKRCAFCLRLFVGPCGKFPGSKQRRSRTHHARAKQPFLTVAPIPPRHAHPTRKSKRSRITLLFLLII